MASSVRPISSFLAAAARPLIRYRPFGFLLHSRGHELTAWPAYYHEHAFLRLLLGMKFLKPRFKNDVSGIADTLPG